MTARQISNFEFRGLDGFIRTGPNLGPEIAGILSLATPHRRAFSQVIHIQHMSARGETAVQSIHGTSMHGWDT